MSVSERQLVANRQNAQASTGPQTEQGKHQVAGNALKHGILSQQGLLADECAGEYQALLDGLQAGLHPAGMMEYLLVEKIAFTLWRQRRLVRAETALIETARQPHEVIKGVRYDLPGGSLLSLTEDDLEPMDAEHVQWCRDVIAELDALPEDTTSIMENTESLLYEDIRDTAAEERQSIEAFLASQGGLDAYLQWLTQYCRAVLQRAALQPQIQAIAKGIRAKRCIPRAELRETLGKYQIMLDNQLYKALKALREAQAWRLKTLNGEVETDDGEAGTVSKQADKAA